MAAALKWWALPRCGDGYGRLEFRYRSRTLGRDPAAIGSARTPITNGDGKGMQRLLDFLLSALALLVLSPLLVPIAIALRLTGEGEIFYV